MDGYGPASISCPLGLDPTSPEHAAAASNTMIEAHRGRAQQHRGGGDPQ